MTEQERSEQRRIAEEGAAWWAGRISGELRKSREAFLKKWKAGKAKPFDRMMFPNMDAAEVFQRFLAGRILQMMDAEPEMELICDFGPKGILLDAARVAGIPSLFFRFRSRLSLDGKKWRVTMEEMTS